MTPSATEAPEAPYKILIAIAFDSTSQSPLAEGAKLALRTPRSELHVVHVASRSSDTGTRTLLPTADGPEPPEDALRRRVEQVWAETGALSVIAHIRSGDPAQEILQLATDLVADVIVVGSHQRSGLQRLILGSVAERVLHHAHCPVLCVVPKDYRDTVPSARVEPVCTDCVETRKRSANAQFWCERHSKPYLQPHIYVPRDDGRPSVPFSY
jgi:nucleotide-binding universal stress UspA family protein